MNTRTYAVSWRENGPLVFAGKLALGLTHLRLEGRASDGNEVLRVFDYGDFGGISTERHNGHREIALTWHGPRITLTVLDGAGAFAELVDELRRRAEGPRARSGAAPMRLTDSPTDPPNDTGRKR